MNRKDNSHIEIQRMQHQMLNHFQTHWKLFLAEGILFILLGLCAVVIPQFFTVVLVIFLGWILLFAGAVHLGRALAFYRMPGFGSWFFMGLLQAAVGYWFIAHPAAGVVTLTILMVLFFAFEGLAKISLALVVRPLTNWGLILFSGITALVFALIVSISLSQTSQWLLGLFLGINMFFMGWSLVKIGLYYKEIH